MTQDAKKGILRLVRARYKVPATVALLVEDEAVHDCYLRVRVRAADPVQGFSKLFTVTPDQNYAASEVFDLREDPEELARRSHAQFMSQLVPDNAPIRGDRAAPVTIVIFSDFQCPFCKRAADLLLAAITPDQHQAKLVFRQFPLPMHNWAEIAAEASVCARQQQEEFFWIAHDFFFRHQAELSRSNVIEDLDKELGSNPRFDRQRFRRCLDGGESKASVQADVAFGLANQIQGTPTIFVDGSRVNWAANSDQLKSWIREASTRARDSR